MHPWVQSIWYARPAKAVHFQPDGTMARAMAYIRSPIRPMTAVPNQSRTAAAQAAVERAMAELRRGGIVVLRDDDGHGGLVIAAESCGPRALQRLQGLAQEAPVLVTTRRRAEAIGMEIPPHIAGGMGEHQQADHPRPAAGRAGRHHPAAARERDRRPPRGAEPPVAAGRQPRPAGRRDGDRARQARRACCPPSCWGRSAAIPATTGATGRASRTWSMSMPRTSPPTRRRPSRNLQQVAQAHVPLEGAENARILAWRPSDGGKEHLAIVVGEIDPTEPVLIRLHSECFTGDLLGSLRCDCGVQLRGAIERDRQAGLGRAALSRAGRPRHRPGQQAARLRAAGRRLRHDRRQRAAGLRRRRAHLRAGRHDARAAWASSGCG